MISEEIYTKYRNNGFMLIPTKKDKSPLLATSWLNGFSFEKFQNASFYGIICGDLSGGLECLDFDNHFGDAIKNLTDFITIPEVKFIYDKYLLPIEKSQNGGYHLLYRCTKNDGNKKLASRLKDGRPDAIIETRGQGGYFCAYPSDGYTVFRNDIFDIKTISEQERDILWNNAIAMNECYPSLTKTSYESDNGDRPGDLYNANSDSIDEMKGILTGSGWRDLGGFKWRRPGKDEGISATLGKVAPNIFYCFTANGYPFEPMKAYTPFQVLGLIKFNGDFKEAAKSVAPEKPLNTVNPQKATLQISDIEKIIQEAKIDSKKKIARPPTIISIKEQQATSYIYKRVFTLGNFSCIIGKAKSRKTFLLSLITSAALSKEKDGKFVGEMVQGKTDVLYFDTEQGEYDCQHVISRIEEMSGNSINLHGYSLRPYSPNERCQIIEYIFEKQGSKTGLCIIDGIADLAFAINDEQEATRVTTILLRLSKVHNCHISTVIHQNKNDNFATGHLGSSIMKKAEVLISVTKKGDVSEIACDMIRGSSDFEPFEMFIDLDGIPQTRVGIPNRKEREFIPELLEPIPTFAEREQEIQFTDKMPLNMDF